MAFLLPMLKPLSDILYILSPILAFLPQIYRNKILFSPLLSVLTIISAILKIFHFQCEEFSVILLYQFVVIVALHFYLISRYKQPLRHLEMKLFKPELYLKYGLVNYAFGLIAGATAFIDIMFILNLGHTFGGIACFSDVLITFFQIMIYRNLEDKPSELFLVWIVGDLIKIVSMLLWYKAPIEYILAIALQMSMNAYIAFN